MEILRFLVATVNEVKEKGEIHFNILFNPIM